MIGRSVRVNTNTHRAAGQLDAAYRRDECLIALTKLFLLVVHDVYTTEQVHLECLRERGCQYTAVVYYSISTICV